MTAKNQNKPVVDSTEKTEVEEKVARTIEMVKVELNAKKEELSNMSGINELPSRQIKQFESIATRMSRTPESNGFLSDVTVKVGDTEIKFSDIVKQIIENNSKPMDKSTKEKVSTIKAEIKTLETELIKIVTA